MERFDIIREATPKGDVFLVKDTATGRIREATYDWTEAIVVAAWLNLDKPYISVEDCLVAS